MNYTLQTAQAKAIISSKGGELLSLQSSDGLEYVWQGNPAYWASHAPHLFPYVGRLTEGQYIMDNQKHSLGIHGFFRFQELKQESLSENSVVLSLTASLELLNQYDRNFQVVLSYKLQDSTLKISFQAENHDSRNMYFGYGGHPGFRVPLDDTLQFQDYYLDFSDNCQPVAIGMSPTCYVQGKDLPVLLEQDHILPLRHSLFDNDAIVMRNMSSAISLRTSKNPHGVTVSYPQMPYLGLWHKPQSDAPYVCIEPWTSLPSRQDIIETFEEKHDLIVLAPGKTYQNDWEITIF